MAMYAIGGLLQRLELVAVIILDFSERSLRIPSSVCFEMTRGQVVKEAE
jgi:hypothetical protein